MPSFYHAYVLSSFCNSRQLQQQQQQQQQQGVENEAVATGTTGTASAIAAPTSTAKMTTAVETARTTVPTAPFSIADDFDSDSDSPQNTTVVARGSDVDFDPKPRLGETTTAPVPATEDDLNHLLPAPGTTPGTTAMDVDFDSDTSPNQTTVAATVTAANVDFDSCRSPAQTAAMTTAGTTADIDFDSDASPAKLAVTVATGTAADVDFDSDSSVETPGSAAVANVVGVSFDSEPLPPTVSSGVDNNQAEELLRLASEVEEEGEGVVNSTSTGLPADNSDTHPKIPEPLRQGIPEAEVQTRCFPPAAAGDHTGRHPVESGQKSDEACVASSAKKRRRCGTVYLGGSASERGFCASSLSQR